MNGLQLTSCGHLATGPDGKPLFCSKCKPVAALEEQANIINGDLQNLFDSWFKRKFSIGTISGCLLGASTAMAQTAGVTREQYINYLQEFWPNE
jgi:hypothetical protein